MTTAPHPYRPYPAAVAASALLLVSGLLAGCSGDGLPPTAAPPTTSAPRPSSTGPSAGPSTTGPSTAGPSTAGSLSTAPTVTPQTRLAPGDPTVLAAGLDVPWGLAFLPDGAALVSERDTARIVRVAKDGRVSEVARLAEVDPSGEGGLLGLAVSPTYARDGLVYAYFTSDEDNRIARFRLAARPRLEPIVTGIPISGIHNGGRIAFGPDGMLYAGTGDAAERGRSQDLGSLGGKVLRMTPEGRPAAGNPFPDSLVYSFGHRNVQGLAWDERGRLFATEFGQNRFDEVNLIEPGRNYGWPAAEGRAGDARFTEPLVTWRTSEASPSGAAVAGGSLYVAALRGERLWQVGLKGSGAVEEPRALLSGRFGRLRHVALAPDGSLWVLTSNRDGRGDPTADDDRVLRIPLSPA